MQRQHRIAFRTKCLAVFLLAGLVWEFGLTLRQRDFITNAQNENAVFEIPQQNGETERLIAEAENLNLEAKKLQDEWTEDSYQRAIVLYEKALENWQKSGENKKIIDTFQSLGDIYLQQGNSPQALEYYQKALSFSRKIRNTASESRSLSNISVALLSLGKKTEALKFAQQSVNLARTLDKSPELVFALNQLAEVYSYSGKANETMPLYQEALTISQDLQNKEGQATTLLNIGYTFGQLQQNKQALEYYEKALPIWNELNNRRKKAENLVAIGHHFNRIGETQKALNNYSQAKLLMQNAPAYLEKAALLNGLGLIHERLGFLDKALQNRQESLANYQFAQYPQGEAIMLLRIADSYLSLEDIQNASSFYQKSLAMFQSLKDKAFEAYILRNIGQINEKQHNLIDARHFYEKALQINQSIKEKREIAYNWNSIGHLAEIESNFPIALQNYQKALKLNRENSDLFGESTTLFNIARVQQKQGNLNEAKLMMEAALLRVESLRSKVAGQDLRSSYFASVHELYENYIDLLMQLHQADASARFDVAAWQTSERARARSLFEALSEAGKASNEIDKELLEKERALHKSLGEKEAKRLELLRKQAGEAEIKPINQEIDALTAELEDLRSKIRGSESNRSETPNLVSLEELQGVLTDDALVLEFSLGEKQSYLWAITRNSVQTFVLPSRAEIENSAKVLRESLIVRQHLNREASLSEQRAQIQEAEQKFQQESVNLSRMLLSQLQLSNQKLLIIPDGALQYVPFEALPLPNQQVPLITNHEIVYQPSAATLAALEKAVANRASAPKDVAVVADPVFSLNEAAKNAETTRSVDDSNQELLLTLRDADWIDGSSNIPSLPASRVEAETILKNAGSSNNLSAIGFQANKSLATGEELKQYRIVHFATHGVLNPKNPEQSGLILSLYDEKGQPQDGFLRLSDIYALNLPTDLVVLSACSTGLGKEVRGEGLVGLTRGFLSAGAARTVSSLWKVNDEATAELMSGFYQTMLQKGLTPAAALREAKLKMMQDSRWNAPYFWAGFVVQGEFKEKIEITRQNSLFDWRIYVDGIILLTLLAGGYLIARKVLRR